MALRIGRWVPPATGAPRRNPEENVSLSKTTSILKEERLADRNVHTAAESPRWMDRAGSSRRLRSENESVLRSAKATGSQPFAAV